MAITSSARVRAAVIATFGAGALLIADGDSDAAGQRTERVNVKPSGAQTNQPGGGLYPSVSADGSRVVFTSAASDMLSSDKDKGGRYQVYMRNRDTDANVLVSVSSSGAPANGNSFFPLISANGKAVVFMSEATNLVPGDDNGHQDVFLRNLETKKTYLVSDKVGKSRRSANNNSWPAGISNNGKAVAFVSAASNLAKDVTDSNQVEDVFHWVYSVDSAGLHTKTRLASHRAATQLAPGNAVSGGVLGGGDRGGAAISGNGDCVAFGSRATNLTPGSVDDNNEEVDAYEACGFIQQPTQPVHRISVNVQGQQGNFASYTPSLNATGRVVAFYSTATNLVDDDTNGVGDVFVTDLSANLSPTSVVRANLGTPDPTTLDDQDHGGAALVGSQALSGTGTRIAFTSFGKLVSPFDCTGEQVYLRDLISETTTLVSIMTDGHCGDRFSNYANISRDGHWVVWTGAASKLVSKDTNNDQDEFIRGPF